MKSFKQYLQEMPIANYQLIGDFNKPHGFRDKRDRMILQHPKSIEITKKKWTNTSYDFDLYFVNTTQGDKHTEVGQVSLDQVKEMLGDEVYEAVKKDHDQDHIQIIFTNNKGSQRAPLTGWMMAHRFFHALGASGRFGKQSNAGYFYEQTGNELIKNLSEILESYNVGNFPRNGVQMMGLGYGDLGREPRKNQLIMKAFLTQISTFKSARDNKVRDWFEFLNEYGAQYITTGKIKFNSAPRCFTSSHGVKNGGKRTFCAKEEELSEINSLLSGLAEQLEYSIDSLISSVIGDIFIM